LAKSPKIPLVQQVQAAAQQPLMNIVYKRITGMLGTVEAKIIALTKLQAQENTSA
jgi:hypothetical protein